jgi:hypothetical protein
MSSIPIKIKLINHHAIKIKPYIFFLIAKYFTNYPIVTARQLLLGTLVIVVKHCKLGYVSCSLLKRKSNVLENSVIIIL